MKALLIEFDLQTGKRAGDINPKDLGLRCLVQNLESSPAKEIRIIEDGRDIRQYEGIPGVTILNTAKEINEAVDREMPILYSVDNEQLFRVALEKMAPEEFRRFTGRPTQEILRECHRMGIPGVRERRPPKVAEE